MRYWEREIISNQEIVVRGVPDSQLGLVGQTHFLFWPASTRLDVLCVFSGQQEVLFKVSGGVRVYVDAFGMA